MFELEEIYPIKIFKLEEIYPIKIFKNHVKQKIDY